VLQKLILACLISLKMTASVYAGDVESKLVPQVKKIIINQVQHEANYQLAYKRIQKIAQDAINYNGQEISPELDEAFAQIQKELSFVYMDLSKEQMVALIIKAINS
jgi:hypothetical protein